MTNTAPLDERIATALAGRPSSSELGKLLDEAKVADRQAEIDLAAASDRALDPATPPTKVAEARQAMADAQFVRDRLANATKRLEDLQREAAHLEAEAARQAQVSEIIQRREALAAEVREQYTALAVPLADLLRRLADVDGQCLQHGLDTVERIVRPGSTSISAVPLTLCRLVDFEVRPDGWYWVDGRGTGQAVGTPEVPRQRVTVQTVRVILLNTQGGPRGVNLSDGRVHVVEPRQTSPELTVATAELPGLRTVFDVKEVGPGIPATRIAA